MNQIPPEDQRAIKEQLGAELAHPLGAHYSKIHEMLEKTLDIKLPTPVIAEEIRLKLAIAEALTCLQLNAPGLARDALVRALLPQKPDPAFSNPPF